MADLAKRLMQGDWRYFAGPHLSQGVDNMGRLSQALMGFVGPQADVQGMVQDARAGNQSFAQGDYMGALGNYGAAAAAIPMMALPGSTGSARKLFGVSGLFPPQQKYLHENVPQGYESLPLDQRTSIAESLLSRHKDDIARTGQRERDEMATTARGVLGSSEDDVIKAAGVRSIDDLLGEMPHQSAAAALETWAKANGVNLGQRHMAESGSIYYEVPTRDSYLKLRVADHAKNTLSRHKPDINIAPQRDYSPDDAPPVNLVDGIAALLARLK